MAAGGVCYWSSNNVLLTEGLSTGRVNLGIPPEYIREIKDCSTGEIIVPLPTPNLTVLGAPEGGERIAEIVVTPEEADRVLSSVGFTVNELLEDQAAASSLAAPPDSPDADFGGETDLEFQSEQKAVDAVMRD